MKLEDFTLELAPHAGPGYRVRASCSLAGEARGTFVPPFSPDQLQDWSRHAPRASRRDLQRNDADRAADLDAEAIGDSLFQALFTDRIVRILERSQGCLDAGEGSGLRIRLSLDLTEDAQADLHGLPWELLRNPETGDFLSLSRRSPIVRYLDVPRRVRERLILEPFRILTIAAQPRGVAALDLDREKENLRQIETRVRGLEIRYLDPPRFDRLRPTLLEGDFHALHIMGHGDFHPETGEGSLLFETRDGLPDPIPARALSDQLTNFDGLRLVVLNACDSGRAGTGAGVSPFSGLAPALVRRGLPAVLAMQLPISDRAAIGFSTAFYTRLTAGDPIDVAVTEGRQAVHAADHTSPEWAIPALFLRVSDGTIFRPRDLPPEARETPGLDHLRVGNYNAAISLLRRDLAREPADGLRSVVLGIASARGAHLRSLPYRTAKDMHRLFAAALGDPRAAATAAAALLALKVDYFAGNAVSDGPPGLDDVLAFLDRGAPDDGGRELLNLINLSDRARDLLARCGALERRSS